MLHSSTIAECKLLRDALRVQPQIWVEVQSYHAHIYLHLPRLTGLFSFDNDIVRGLEQVTAALACEGQIGKVRAGPHGAKMCCLAKDKAGFMEEFLLSPLPDHYPLLLRGQRSLAGYSPWGCRVRHS